MPNFDTLKIFGCGKHCEKRRNCLKQAISPLLTMFSTLCTLWHLFFILNALSNVVCNLFQFGPVLNFVVWLWVKLQKSLISLISLAGISVWRKDPDNCNVMVAFVCLSKADSVGHRSDIIVCTV